MSRSTFAVWDITTLFFTLLIFCGTAISQDSTYEDPATFEKQMLSETNLYRVRHQAPPASWNANIAAAAATYASQCNFTHPQLSNEGSNLAAGYANPLSVVDAWYDEVSVYDFNNPGPNPGALHFTQLVWVASTTIGCGAFFCNGQGYVPNSYGGIPGWYTVCYYAPEGNVVYYGNDPGYLFAQNVLPQISSTSSSAASSTSSSSQLPPYQDSSTSSSTTASSSPIGSSLSSSSSSSTSSTSSSVPSTSASSTSIPPTSLATPSGIQTEGSPSPVVGPSGTSYVVPVGPNSNPIQSGPTTSTPTATGGEQGISVSPIYSSISGSSIIVGTATYPLPSSDSSSVATTSIPTTTSSDFNGLIDGTILSVTAPTTIATDGALLIINPPNPTDGLITETYVPDLGSGTPTVFVPTVECTSVGNGQYVLVGGGAVNVLVSVAAGS